jgi:2'-5' RNA ligase
VRLFVALTPPSACVEELAAAVDDARRAAPDLRWAPPEQWHLTLTFLGEVEERMLPDLELRLARSAARHAPLNLKLAGAGRFGNRVLWLGVHGDTDGLRKLAASVRAAARRARLPIEDRPYRPHLTLARARDPAADLRPVVQRMAGFAGLPWTADAVHLVRSYLGTGAGRTARHEAVASWSVGRRPPLTTWRREDAG